MRQEEIEAGVDKAQRDLAVHEYIDVQKELAIKRLIQSAYLKHYRKQIAEDKCTNEYLLEVVNRLGKDAFAQDPRGRKKNVLRKFITISAKDDIDPLKFFEKMQKCIKKQMLQSNYGYYVLEQRSEADQEPYGWHIHWLVEFVTTSSPAIISQQVYQCYSRFLGGSNYVDVKDVFSDQDWAIKLNYIKGDKKEDKMPKVLKDRKLREKLGIPEIQSY